MIFSHTNISIMSFSFDKPTEQDRQTSGGLPAFRLLQYRAAKTPPHMAKQLTAEAVKDFFDQGTVGFSYWDKEKEHAVSLKEGTFVLLGQYWKLGTYTGGDKNAVRYTSNMVLNIKDDIMRVYANGDATQHEGTYRQLKDKGIWGAETKISLYWVVWNLDTKELCSIQLTSTVKNGFKVAVLKAYGKPVNRQTVEKEGLYGLTDGENFHVFQYNGVAVATPEGTQYKGEGEAYFQPRFECGVLRAEKNPEEHAVCALQKELFFGAIKTTRPTTAEPAAAIVSAVPEIPPLNLPKGWTAEPVKDPFEEATDLPF